MTIINKIIRRLKEACNPALVPSMELICFALGFVCTIAWYKHGSPCVFPV
jgi:hypothetical protein